MLYAELRNGSWEAEGSAWDEVSHSAIPSEISPSQLLGILEFCNTPRSRAEIQDFCGYRSSFHFMENILKPLLKGGQLVPTILDKPTSPNQKYISGSSPQA